LALADGRHSLRLPQRTSWCRSVSSRHHMPTSRQSHPELRERTDVTVDRDRWSHQRFRIGAKSQIFGAPSQDLLASVD
jgi:hypothetical protein